MAALLVLFFGYAWLPLTTQGIWSSPDETAVAYFAQNGLSVEVPYAEELGGLIGPRSTVVSGGELKPSGWLGLPQLLSVFERIDFSIVELLVPLIAVLAVAAWFKLVLKVTGSREAALAATVLLAVHPGWWHYTARGLHPNVVFVSMLIFALFFFLQTKGKYQRLYMFLGGFAVAEAIFIRTNEAVWIVPLVVFAAIVLRKHWKSILTALAGALIPVIMIALAHTAVYGSITTTGYTVESDPLPVEVEVEGLSVVPDPSVIPYVLPFGFHELNIVRNVWVFHLKFFHVWTILALFGLVMLLLDIRHTFTVEQKKRAWQLLGGAGFVTFYLFIMYGSWHFRDNPDPTDITIGTSYIRYWLPVTVFMTALSGYGISRAMQRWAKRMGDSIVPRLLLIVIVLGSYMTFYAPDEGILEMQETLRGNMAERSAVLSATTASDIIVVDRADKILFPSRNVIVPLRDEGTYASLGAAHGAVRDNGASLYYFGLTLPEEDIEHLDTEVLAEHDLRILEVIDVGQKTLYLLDSI